MKIKRRKAAENQLITDYGVARFYQQPIERCAWKDPAVPEYKRNWIVRFQVGGQTWKQSAGPLYPVKPDLREVKEWAATLLRTRWEAMRAGKLEELEAVVREVEAVMLSELRQVYLQHVPPGKPDYRKNIARLCAILTESTGLTEDAIPVTDSLWSRGLFLGWVRMRQEHFRRGWTVRGAAPQDAWERLRGELKAGRLPGIDKTSMMECNTTILTYLRCAKAVFANQGEYLQGLQLPDLKEFLGFRVDVEAPEGHREMQVDVRAALAAAVPVLAREQPKVHAFYVVATWTGARPITIKGLRGDALQVREDGTGVVELPAAKGGRKVCVPIDAGAVQALLEVRTERSLIGAQTVTEAERIYRAHNEWLSEHGVTGTLKSYQLRHQRLQQYRNEGGLELAAAGGGHTTTAMVERRYTENAKLIPLVPPFERMAG